MDYKNPIETAWSTIIESLGFSLEDPNFKGTPERIFRMYKEIFAGLSADNLDKLNTHLSKTFPCTNDEMVVIKGSEAWSMCPHHFLPVQYTVDIGYLPKDCVIGLSKMPRVLQLLAKRPVLQEQYTQDIVDFLEKHLQPRGIAVKVTGIHLCVAMRGVKSANSSVITSAMTGVFKDSIISKQEFLQFL